MKRFSKITIITLGLVLSNLFAKEQVTNLSVSDIYDEYSKENYDLILKIGTRAEVKNSREKTALNYILAHTYFRTRRFPQAIEHFKLVLPDAPFKHEVLNNIAAAYLNDGHLAEAKKILDECLKIAPNYQPALENREYIAMVIRLKKDKSKRIPIYQSLNDTVRPGTMAIHRGWFNFYLGHTDEAIRSFKEALAADPKNAFIQLSLGYAYDSANNYSTAIKYYTGALAIDPDYPDVWNNLAISRYFSGDEVGAIRDFNKAIQLNPKFPYPYNNLGFLYLEKGDLKLALKYLSDALAANPREPNILGEILAGLAILDSMNGRKEEASENKKKAIKANPSLSEISYLSQSLRWSKKLIKEFAGIK